MGKMLKTVIPLFQYSSEGVPSEQTFCLTSVNIQSGLRSAHLN